MKQPPHGAGPLARTGLIAVLALTACDPARERPLNGEPNLVIVAVSSLRPDHLGLHGYGRPTTPNLDRFARHAFKFEAWSASTWTTPALLSILTSLHPSVHQVRGYPNPGRMSENVTTLAEVVRSRGYATAAFTEGGFAHGAFGLDQGFQLFHEPALDADSTSMPGLGGLPDNVRRAVEWLEQPREPPFLLFFHTQEQQAPYRPPERALRRMRPDYDEAREHASVARAIEAWNAARSIDREAALLLTRHDLHCGLAGMPSVQGSDALRASVTRLGVAIEDVARAPELRQWLLDLYDAELAHVDDQLSDLWASLERLCSRESTVVVILGEHGEGLGEHGSTGHGTAFFDEVLRIPLLIRLPPESYRPRPMRDAARSIDVMPTLLDLIGYPLETLALQGESLVPFMRGDHRERPIFSQGLRPPELDTWISLRFGRWHFLFDSSTKREQLFDLYTDPAHELDLVEEHQNIRTRFLRRIHKQEKFDRMLRDRIRTDLQPLDLPWETLRQLLRLGHLSDASGG
jgi:arylsulfatase A-like enzyme